MAVQAFHLSTQTDNRTNVKIGKLTSRIAQETQRDSSSMITIAAVTMFFLPGTFISVTYSLLLPSYTSTHRARG